MLNLLSQLTESRASVVTKEAGVLVALKALPSEVSCDAAEMQSIRKNFALVSRLHHPHIASVLHLHRVEIPDRRAA